MDARTRILHTMRGEPVPGVPWCADAVRGSALERELRNRGMAVVVGKYVHEPFMPNVRLSRNEQWKEGSHYIHDTFHTPVGEVTQTRRVEPGYGSQWVVEHLIRRRDDYRVVEFMVRDTQLLDNRDAVARQLHDLGGDGIVLGRVTRTPYQQLYTELMGAERLAYDWSDNLPELESLLVAMGEQLERVYQLAADSPAKLIWCPDNTNDLMVSPKLFECHHLRWYNRLATVLHEAGKILSVHMDGRLGSLVQAIGRTSIDVIDGLTPPPMGNVSVRDAKAAWPDKVVWLNIPGSMFLREPKEITDFTVGLLREGMVGARFILGVTEAIPCSVERQAMLAVADAVQQFERGAR